ncbi:MAG: asparaginyl/glutamyl-tRNA amidotransferase subunit [Subtercola sp.]|jgi:aspartyl-tRNA(Asn)/glutamyl-tRNA(Gln) amidotransferase subunit C|nr:asparaginyl/glutamyl-tRNA amidotransferase subunit [Subtercola sp.]
MSTETPSSVSTSANSRPAHAAGDSSAGEITTAQVEHLAGLARIRLTPDEVTKLTRELVAIVDNVAKVTEVATPDVPATSHPIPLQNVFREDVVGVTLTQEQALSGAPEHDGSRFRVSAILGEEQ